ncbi:MAG TPA: hypothetical protein DCO86_05295 [Spirochaetaceae bacterium]|nr:hypothetical protein [Spirochaetaceae bacterium]
MKAKDYRKAAWNNLAGKRGIFALIVLIMGIIMGVAGTLGGIGSLVLSGPFALGFSGCCLLCARGGQIKVEDLFDGFKSFLKSFLLNLVNGIFIALWSLLLIVPGIIAALNYSMSFYILRDDPEIGANDARKKSIEMMRGRKWQLFCLKFSFIGWWLLCILTFGILVFWVVPHAKVAEAEFYENLKKAGPIESVDSIDPVEPDKIGFRN